MVAPALCLRHFMVDVLLRACPDVFCKTGANPVLPSVQCVKMLLFIHITMMLRLSNIDNLRKDLCGKRTERTAGYTSSFGRLETGRNRIVSVREGKKCHSSRKSQITANRCVIALPLLGVVGMFAEDIIALTRSNIKMKEGWKIHCKYEPKRQQK